MIGVWETGYSFTVTNTTNGIYVGYRIIRSHHVLIALTRRYLMLQVMSKGEDSEEEDGGRRRWVVASSLVQIFYSLSVSLE